MMFRSIRSFSTTVVTLKVAYKKPGNAFQFFFKENFESLKSSTPDATIGKTASAAASQWKALSEGEKKKYYDAYNKALDAYKAKDPELAYAVRPDSPLKSYISKNTKTTSKELGTKDKTAVSEALTTKWNELSEEEKKPYLSKYSKDLRKYKTEKLRLMGLVRPTSAYLRFLLDLKNSGEFATSKMKEIMRAGADQWKTLSESDKSKYEAEYKKDLEAYNAKKAELFPPRAISKYQKYVKEKFPELRDANPGAKNTELIKLIAEEWKHDKDYY